MSTVGSLLICVIQVTIVAIAGILTSLAFRRSLRTSAGLPLAATLVAVIVLTLGAFSSRPSWLHQSSPTAAVQTHADLNSDLSSSSLTESQSASAEENVASTGILGTKYWAWLLTVPQRPTMESNQATSGSESSGFHWSWQNIVLLLILGGLTVGLIRLIGGLWGIRIFVRSSRPLKHSELCEQVDLIRAELGCIQSVEVRECTQLVLAATVGWRKPVILLSGNWRMWSPAQLRSVLAHEIAHIVRGDFLTTIAAQAGVLLHFYHPLVHWLANRLRLEQELAADAMAAQIVGGSQIYLQAVGELALKNTHEPVGWPVHTFLPTRRTFLRRIEMLRDMKFLSGKAPRTLRWGTLLCVAAVTLVTIGIRPPMGAETQSAVAAQEKPKTAPILPEPRGVTLGASDGSVGAGSGKNISAPEPLTPQYVPADALMVVAARPEALNQFVRSFNATKALPEDVPNPLEEFANCEQLSLVIMPFSVGESLDARMAWCLTFTSAEACDLAANNMVSRVKAPGQVFQFLWKDDAKSLRIKEEVIEPNGYARAITGERTLLIGGRETILKMIVAGSQSQSPLTTTDAWKKASSGSVAIAVDAIELKKLMSMAPAANPLVAVFSPLWNSAVSHTLGIEIGDRVQLKLTSLANDAAGARKVGNTLTAGMTMLSGMLSSLQASPNSKLNAATVPLLSILEEHQLEQQDNRITLRLEADLVTVLGAIVSPLMQARAAAQETQHRNNLKMIMLAMHNYHDIHGAFPTASGTLPGYKHPRSWRVELLPYLDQANLYNEYKDEPWNSDANLKVLARMPAVFRHPSQPTNLTSTSYIAAYGKGLLFEPNTERGTRIQDVTDGCSNTIAILEAKTDIPWTKPEDILIDVTEDTLPKFGGFDDNTGFVVGIADGSVRRISTSLDVNLLKHLLTISGGEVVPANY
ncbi:MAG: M56 family metallopeptidase [Planctomycetaceae bacterium]